MAKKRRKKTEREKLLADIEYLWKVIVRYRDKYICRWCGKGHVPGDPSYHASHIIPKSAGHAARFNLNNGKGLCFHCHINVWHKDPVAARRFLATIKTKKEIDELEKLRSEKVKYTIDELKQMQKEYQALADKYQLEYDKWLDDDKVLGV